MDGVDNTSITLLDTSSIPVSKNILKKVFYGSIRRMETNTLLKIAVRRNNTVTLPVPAKENGHIAIHVIASLQQEINQYGYSFAPETLAHLTSFSKKQLKKVHEDLRAVLNFETNKDLAPFYPNFPQEVREASEYELFINSQIHYFGALIDLSIRPARDLDPKSALGDENNPEDHANYIVLSHVSEKDYPLTCALEIAHSKVSMSLNDAKDLTTCLYLLEDINAFIDAWDENMDNKENLIHVLFALKGLLGENFETLFKTRIKTATDLLRYAMILATGRPIIKNDSSLTFTMPRSTRRLIMSSLNEMPVDKVLFDMKRHQDLWKKFSRVLHPGEYKNSYPSAVECFTRLSAGNFGRSYNSHVEEHLVDKNTRKACAVLVNMPGEFARRLNELLSIALNKEERKYILKTFRSIVADVPSNILWQMYPAFKIRNTAEIRYINPKGGNGLGVALPMPEKAYSNKVVREVRKILIEGLLAQYSLKEELGNVWVDPELENFALPLGIREASPSANAIARGSRVKLSESNIQRAYVWWQNKEESDGDSFAYPLFYGIDVDLSAIAYDENFVQLFDVSYRNLRTDDGSIVHSGDIVTAPRPHGAAEYIDFDKSKLLESGVRYVSVTVQIYTGGGFNEFDCLGGIMDVWDDESQGGTFDARKVSKSFEIQSPVKNALPMVLDLESNEMIWVDGLMHSQVTQGNNTDNHGVVYASLAESTVKKMHSNLYQLFTLHAHARGVLVDSREDADVEFSVVDGVPSVKLATVLSDFL